MATVLIPYGTTEGRTAKTAEVLAAVIRERAHQADAVEIKSLAGSVPDRYDAVIIKRHMMQKIAKDKPGHLGIDISRDYVYTEWDAVKRVEQIRDQPCTPGLPYGSATTADSAQSASAEPTREPASPCSSRTSKPGRQRHDRRTSPRADPQPPHRLPADRQTQRTHAKTNNTPEWSTGP
jgi:hypothetical protein